MPHWDMKSDFLGQVKNSPVWITFLISFFHQTCWPSVQLDEMEPREDDGFLCSFVVLPHGER